MHRFFVNQLNTITKITGEDVKHITRVLRLQNGDTVTLCDGQGHECEAAITGIENNTVTFHCGDIVFSRTEPNTQITLFQGLPKSGKMELIIQKCVEIGIHEITPILTERCVVQPKESFSARIERWQKVSEEAAKQSRRGYIPKITSLCKLRDLDFCTYDLVLVAYENEENTSLKSIIKSFSGKKAAIIIGPEGGFAESEIKILNDKGAVCISLGPRILRTETAGMTLLAQFLYEVES